MNEEQRLRAQLAELHRQHQLACEPIVKRLAQIEACKAPRIVTVQPYGKRDLMTYDEWAGTLDNEVIK